MADCVMEDENMRNERACLLEIVHCNMTLARVNVDAGVFSSPLALSRRQLESPERAADKAWATMKYLRLLVLLSYLQYGLH